jgi:uncharacterized OsmC-like protein
MTERHGKIVCERQDPLRKRYQLAAEEAVITDRASTVAGVDSDPFHGTVTLGAAELGVALPFGIHRAVGGFSDLPNPGDLLCGALAACLDATLRIIAQRLGVALTALEVEVTAEVDVRGTLLVERSVPVGFQAMHCAVTMQAVDGTDEGLLKSLVDAAEYSCVNLQTLLAGICVQTRLNVT